MEWHDQLNIYTNAFLKFQYHSKVGLVLKSHRLN
jgi:hypothetical protein